MTDLRRALLFLGVLNIALALLVASQLVFGGSLSAGQRAFATVAMVGYVGGAVLVIAGALAFAVRGERSRRVVRWAAPLVFTLVIALLFLDAQVYVSFRFHFNGLVLRTLFAPGGFAALKIPAGDLIGLFVGTLILFFVEWKLLRVFEARVAPRVSSLRWVHVAAAVAAFAIADRVVYAAADLQRDYRIPRAARVVPGYQKFTVRRHASTYLGWEAGSTESLGKRPAASGAGLAYPAKPLTWAEPSKKPNILWIMLESWRHDAFGEEHSPEIWKIAQKSKTFHQHISGGNNTSFGLFSMFYGLYGSQRSAFMSSARGPVLLERTTALGYRHAFYASFPLTWAEATKYIFADRTDRVFDVWPAPHSSENDPLVIDDFLKFVDAGPKESPFFSMILLDSSHAPYTFPEAYGKFTPYPSDAKFIRYLDVMQQPPELRNRYFNAILWEDHQVGRLWVELEKRGILDDTIVVITGDHGEEFNEYGFRTHSGGFSPAQIHVPLVLWVPGAEPASTDRLTGHEDLAATFAETLGVQNPPEDYTQGHSLLGPAENPYVVTCSWWTCAVVDSGGFVVFGLEGDYAMDFDVLDRNYKPVADPRAAMSERGPQMVDVMRDLGAFLR